MDRKTFFKNSVIMGGASLLPINNVFSQSLKESGLDKLTDKDGNFALQPLPYAESFLEPSMDQETLHLHYTFHHGDAVKAANKDLAMIKKAMERACLPDRQGALIPLTTGQKNYLTICHLIFSTLFSGPT
jgi:Fe-Mn family superoxide dismutase